MYILIYIYIFIYIYCFSIAVPSHDLSICINTRRHRRLAGDHTSSNGCDDRRRRGGNTRGRGSQLGWQRKHRQRKWKRQTHFRAQRGIHRNSLQQQSQHADAVSRSHAKQRSRKRIIQGRQHQRRQREYYGHRRLSQVRQTRTRRKRLQV